VKESQQSLDVDALIQRAQTLWRNASVGANRGRVELYAKASLRMKATRSLDGAGVNIDRAFEAGTAVRTFASGRALAGFAASSGLSEEVVEWAVTTAGRNHGAANAAAPDASEVIPDERRDVDGDQPFPAADELSAGLMCRRDLDWIEAGTTAEVLVGLEGWIAARRRHRLWALVSGSDQRLLAQRGFRGWERLLDSSPDVLTGIHHPNAGSDLVLLPRAASVVVSALVEAFHGISAEWVDCGEAWDVIDDPANPDGLVGGSFDDAGFSTKTRTLAHAGVWVGGLRGPGTFRRPSFREPPRETPSNLVMRGGSSNELQGLVVRRCHLLPVSPDEWVLELDPVGSTRAWVRVLPRRLLASCRERDGGVIVTAEGPILPAIRFEGMARSG